ncbi:MAG TPA: dTDP-4-dehydrorhamnose reductase [Blastocatellia bacterium]|nr:dTDP-4-dehydrorhamnose reductase [Blastocatellia bacterium]
MSSDAPVIVLGAAGQLGRALTALLDDRCVGLTRSQLDLAQPSRVVSCLDRLGPSSVINAAAYTQVDKAEEEEGQAFQINAQAPGLIARWCAKAGVPFLHFSTDYVFPGTGIRPWTESDSVAPVNAYGRTKAEGEKQVAEAGGRWLVLRTSWVYSLAGKNFLNTILRLATEREVLNIVDDQHGAPTFASDLAEAAITALEQAMSAREFPAGVYHVCNSGETTWHGFAKAIIEEATARGMSLKVDKLNAIPTSAYHTPARRPLNCRLNTDKARSVLGLALRDWRSGLARCMERL